MKLFSLALLVFVTALLGGCLVSSNPFYDAHAIVQDDRFVGLYPNDETQSVWEVTKTSAPPGRYRLILHERGTQSEYTGTLFEIGKATFLDVFAEKAADIPRDPGGPPTAGELLKELTADRRHVVFRIEVGDGALALWVALPNNLATLLDKEPQLKRTEHEEQFLELLEPTQTLQKLLTKYGSAQALFSEKEILSKKKG
jgi:hypothetical protein